jgi:hypothetical protein
MTSYLTKLSTTLPPPLATVEFDSSANAPPSSNTNAWTKKRNPVLFQDNLQTRSSPNKTTLMSGTSSAADSINTAPTQATQLSHTEALIDRKLAALRTELESSITSYLTDTRGVVAPLIDKFDALFTKMEELLSQRSPVSAAPPTQTPMPLNTTVPTPNYHHNAHYDQPYASREPDTISIHSQSPARPLPPHGYPYLGSPITYQYPPTYHMDPHQSHSPPPNSDPLIHSESNPHPDFAAQQQQQQQPYYYHQPQDHPINYTQHQFAATSSTTSFITPTADLSMAELHHTMAEIHRTITDPNQSILDHTMTDQNTTPPLDDLPDSPRSPPAALKASSRPPLTQRRREVHQSNAVTSHISIFSPTASNTVTSHISISPLTAMHPPRLFSQTTTTKTNSVDRNSPSRRGG